METILLSKVNPEQLTDLIVTGIKEELKQLLSIKSQPIKENELLTIKEVCKILQCSKTTLWNWDNKGILVPIRTGRMVRYKKSEIENFINSKN